MRVSTAQMAQSGLNAMLEQQSKLSKTQMQISQGKRINTPSDDPAGSARILDLSQAMGVTEQYQKNVTAARQRLQLEENTLVSVGDLLQRVREIALQANNDTQSAQNRIDMAKEVQERLRDLLTLANSRDANGEYLFAGFQGRTQPFAALANGSFSYAGDQGQRFLQIGPTRQVAIGDSGDDVFRMISTGNGVFSVQDNATNTGSGIIDTGSVLDQSAYDGDTYTVVMAATTGASGGVLPFTDTGSDDVLQYELRINGTLIYTASEGDARSLAELVTDINAQQGTTGVAAYLDGSRLYLAHTGATTAPITITESLSGAAEDTDTVTGLFGSALTGINTSVNTITLNAPASAYVVLNSAGTVATSGDYTAGTAMTFSGIQTSITGTPNNGDRFTIAPSANEDMFTTLQNLATALEDGSGTAFHNAVNRALDGMDRAQDKLLQVRAQIGARLGAIETQETANGDNLYSLNESLSAVQDLDYASAISQLNLQLVGLQAAQQAYVKVQGLSLFNYLS